MNKLTVAKKRKVIRMQVTNLIGEIEWMIQEGIGQGVVETLTQQLKSSDGLLKETHSQYGQFITTESVDGEHEQVRRFDGNRLSLPFMIGGRC